MFFARTKKIRKSVVFKQHQICDKNTKSETKGKNTKYLNY
jgi:hypothetical protein